MFSDSIDFNVKEKVEHLVVAIKMSMYRSLINQNYINANTICVERLLRGSIHRCFKEKLFTTTVI